MTEQQKGLGMAGGGVTWWWLDGGFALPLVYIDEDLSEFPSLTIVHLCGWFRAGQHLFTRISPYRLSRSTSTDTPSIWNITVWILDFFVVLIDSIINDTEEAQALAELALIQLPIISLIRYITPICQQDPRKFVKSCTMLSASRQSQLLHDNHKRT